MIFIGKASNVVNSELLNTMVPIGLLSFLGIIMLAVISIYFTDSIVHDVKNIRMMLANISNGKLSGNLEKSTMKRKDEIGDIARSTVQMQVSLRKIVERDALTNIYNRRRGQDRLQEILTKNRMLHMPFHLAIGDIDFFKKVNDTYGHEAGDRVLQNVACVLKSNMVNRGYVARWGGEEFLLVFENMSYEDSIIQLNCILKEIQNSIVILDDGSKVQVTMTFGLARGEDMDRDVLIQKADELLYSGKANGRNQIITVEGVCNCDDNEIKFLTLTTH